MNENSVNLALIPQHLAGMADPGLSMASGKDPRAKTCLFLGLAGYADTGVIYGLIFFLAEFAK